MNTINKIINSKLKSIPDGFEVKEIDLWLRDIPGISSFSVFESFLKREDMTPSMWFALILIIRNKLNIFNLSIEVSNHFEKHIEALSLEKKCDSLKLEEEKSVILDFSKLGRLTKVDLFISKNCKKIILPNNSNINYHYCPIKNIK